MVRRVVWANDFGGHLLGLMFRRRLAEDEGLVLAYRHESRVDTALHMFFVPFPIAAIFLDCNGVVVDKQLARPWRPLYVPRHRAQFVLEATPAVLERVALGERLEFKPLASAKEK